MKKRKTAKWSRLDNAAKIFPSTSTRADTKVFRFACELFESVNPGLLQDALDDTVKEFPHFLSVLRKGLFWYFLDASTIRPVVHLELREPCAPIYDPIKNSLLFSVTCYRRRINLEVYHALTDGTGALQFLRALVHHYLLHAHTNELGEQPPALDYDASISEKLDDSFSKYYAEGRKIAPPVPEREPRAARIQGTRLSDYRLRVLSGELSAKAAVTKAREHQASLTAFLAALFMRAVWGELTARERKRPVVVTVPVNLRNFFESGSARNFFGLFHARYHFSDDASGLPEAAASVAEQFKKELTADRMLKRINDLAALEHNPFARILPLALKNIILKYFNARSARAETVSLSNIGPIDMPDEYDPYIRLFDVFISARRVQMCMCSFRDRLVLSFTSPFVSADVEKRFFRELTAMGLEVTIRSNQPDSE